MQSAEGSPRAWLTALSLIAFVGAALVALGPLEGIPHVTDEVSYTLQARLFASGLRMGPAADNASMLAYPFWQTGPASYSVFPPGWPLLLAVGEKLGAGWLVNPLLGASLPFLTWRLARHWTSPRAALLAAATIAVSPGVLILAGSRMSHTSVLVALAAATVLALEAPRAWRYAVCGLAVAYVVVARPFDAAIVGGPILLLAIHRGRTQAWPVVIAPAVATALVLADNHALTGHALTFPVDVFLDGWSIEGDRPLGCNSLGFGEAIGCVPTYGTWGHTPAKAANIAWDSLLRMDRLLLGVQGSSLIVLAGLWLVRKRPPLLLAVIPLVVLGYSFYWSLGAAYGARFWHALYLVLPLLIGVALDTLLKRWAWLPLAVLPLLGGSYIALDLADSYWCVDGSLLDQVEAEGITEGVIFMATEGEVQLREWPRLGVTSDHHFACSAMLEAGDGLLLMDPTSTTDGIQPRHALPDRDTARSYLEALHPDSPAWISTVDLATGQRRIERLR